MSRCRTPNPVTRIVTVSWSGAAVLPMVVGVAVVLWRIVLLVPESGFVMRIGHLLTRYRGDHEMKT